MSFYFVLPLRAIVFQMLFLSLAIAIEALVFQKQWKLSRKASIEYSLGLNLFSTCLGWLVFFAVQRFLSTNLKKQIITFIFFNNIVENSTVPTGLVYGEVALIVFLCFVFILIAELVFLDVWRNLAKAATPAEQEEKQGNKYSPTITSSLYKRYYDSAKARITSSTILVANAYSGTGILFMLFLTNMFGIK
ncbi:filament integrity protein FraC [Microseira wollei]|uniref:Filament integrity protein FraC n=1 Tax=Microseira wollei NIES-4236 TaxID=2530354 RepID=A0AAV3X477_9CYAN|nr:filament integrity protein FraC [Microseira wollei]GET37607.1 hypothetical protein LYNGBM3L_43460 [Microseira wollei NIES-4236]